MKIQKAWKIPKEPPQPFNEDPTSGDFIKWGFIMLPREVDAGILEFGELGWLEKLFQTAGIWIACQMGNLESLGRQCSELFLVSGKETRVRNANNQIRPQSDIFEQVLTHLLIRFIVGVSMFTNSICRIFQLNCL